MSELFKSKVGWGLAGIHLLTFLACVLYIYLIDRFFALPYIITAILGTPWWILVGLLAGLLAPLVPGRLDMGLNGDSLFTIGFAIGAVINAFLLYLLGFLLTKAFNYLLSIKPKP